MKRAIFYFPKHPLIPTPLIIVISSHFQPPNYSHSPPVYSVLESMNSVFALGTPPLITNSFLHLLNDPSPFLETFWNNYHFQKLLAWQDKPFECFTIAMQIFNYFWESINPLRLWLLVAQWAKSLPELSEFRVTSWTTLAYLLEVSTLKSVNCIDDNNISSELSKKSCLHLLPPSCKLNMFTHCCLINSHL